MPLPYKVIKQMDVTHITFHLKISMYLYLLMYQYKHVQHPVCRFHVLAKP